MRVPDYQNLMRNTGDLDRVEAIKQDWLRDKRNLPLVLMAAAIMKRQQSDETNPGNTEETQ
jgi:hypothetical protein